MTQSMSFGPEATPRPLKILLITTLAATLCGAFLPQLQALLSLSLPGLSQLYLWQFFTYPLLEAAPLGVTFALILNLGFTLFMIWTFGAPLLQRTGTPLFFSLYFGASFVAALFGLIPMFIFHQAGALAGPSPALYALLMVWMMLNAEAQLLFFFTVVLKARILILVLIGINLLIDASNRDWIHLFGSLGALSFSYLFALIVWRKESPFPIFHPFERFLLRRFDQGLFFRKKRGSRQPKIYDIHSGKPILTDDGFMDAMLARISTQGEDALTNEEKKRMQAISAKKSAKKK